MAFYLDTSAAVKLVIPEPETPKLAKWLRRHEGEVVSSDLLRTELLRATRRGAPHRVARARAVLDAVMLIAMPTRIFELAASFEPSLLRSLDALHLAAALDLGEELHGIVTYDERLTLAANAHGVAVVAPR